MVLNPKRAIISNKITRRAVTRGINTYRKNINQKLRQKVIESKIEDINTNFIWGILIFLIVILIFLNLD